MTPPYRFVDGFDRVTGRVDPRRDALRGAADALRRVNDVLARTQAPAEALDAATAAVEAALAALTPYPRKSRYQGSSEGSTAGAAVRDQREVERGHFDHSPVIGQASPLAPPLSVRLEGETLIGHARFGDAFEGPPDTVHGGFVAAAFDELLGLVQSLTGQPGMTASLTVQYRRPTPLHVPIRFEGAVTGIEGRKIFTEARAYAEHPEGDELTADATGLFVTMRPSRFLAMSEARDRAAEQAPERDGAPPA